jgi:hypothetical protein
LAGKLRVKSEKLKVSDGAALQRFLSEIVAEGDPL